MPPKGGWKPALNVSTVLASIGLLLAEPNPDDGLVTDIVSGCASAQRVCLRASACAAAGRWRARVGLCVGAGACAACLAPCLPPSLPCTTRPWPQQTAEFKHQRQVFDAKARQWTQRHAMQGGGDAVAAGAGGGADAAEALAAQVRPCAVLGAGGALWLRVYTAWFPMNVGALWCVLLAGTCGRPGAAAAATAAAAAAAAAAAGGYHGGSPSCCSRT